MSELFEDIMSSLNDIIAYEQGKPVEGIRIHKMSVEEVQTFTPSEIRQIRVNAQMTQGIFARCLGVTQKAVEGWEGGRSHPNGAVRRILGLMKDNPRFADDVGIITR